MKKYLISLILLILFCSSVFAQNMVIDEAILEPKDPILGTVIAIGPGLLAHGFGHFYAEDYKMGLMLFGVEVASLVTIGAGYFIYSSPGDVQSLGGDSVSDVERAGLITMSAGLLFFIGTWMADVAMAGEACGQYNLEHGLEFRIQQESNNLIPGVMYSYNF